MYRERDWFVPFSGMVSPGFFLALCAGGALYERIAVGTLRYSGVGLMCAYTDAVQTAVVLCHHVILTLGNRALDVAVFLFHFHGKFSSSENVTAAAACPISAAPLERRFFRQYRAKPTGALCAVLPL